MVWRWREGSLAQRQVSGHVRNGGVNGWRGKGKETTAPDQECEGDCGEIGKRDRDENGKELKTVK